MVHNTSGSKLLRLLPLLFLLASVSCNKNGNGSLHKGLYSHAIADADVTIPRRVSENGEHISHNVCSRRNGDNDANGNDDDGRLHLNVTISDEDHLLILKRTRRFISPSMIVERHKRDAHYRTKPRSIDCHYEGFVYGKSNSKVAISNCNGLVGFIHTEKGKYWIEPAHHRAKKVEPGRQHLIYKRSAVLNPPTNTRNNPPNKSNNNNKKKKKKRRKFSHNCGTREPKRITELEWLKQRDKVKVQERHSKHKHRIVFQNITRGNMRKHKYSKVKKVRQKRSFSKPRYVEALLVADSTMVEFHEDSDIEQYLLSIMNMVSSLYSHPSIGNLIRVTVVKIVLIDDPLSEPDLNVTINADHTLRSFCKWQQKLNPSPDSDPHHHDVAILVTRKDICARQNYPCNTLGVAHVGGMCKVEKSCSVNEDNGITLAHTITHEMGHNFGMYHDTDKIGCKGRIGNKLHIMTPIFEADTIEVTWSHCSRRDVTNFLDKGMGECLKDEPGEEKEYEYPELPVGAMYNTEIQCQLQFGPEARVCSTIGEICTRLWCDVNGTCTTQLRPAAPGTQCGKHMWCQQHKCVPIMDPPVPIDGGWGEWSGWSECSRTCGAGVSTMTRDCDHPRPAAGGKFCVGERRRYRVCNTEPCPENEPSYRAVQCSAYNNHTHEGKTYTWVPYYEKDEPCELYCSDVNDTMIVPWGDHANDGTPCKLGTRDVCISGICRRVGCDWVVDSTAVEDACGICQGNSTTCNTIDGVYKKQSPGASGYKEMVVIPKGARNIRVEEQSYAENYISIASARSSRFYLNGERHITLPGEYTVAGSQALYERRHEFEKVHIPGPITESILVYVLFRGNGYNPGVKYEYTISKKEKPKQVKYVWVLGDWSQCSVTCGGGVQHRKPLCQETLMSEIATVVDGTSTFVDEANCEPAEKATAMSRACKDEPCPSNWWIGPWQSCSVTCSKTGERAMRKRTVMCVDGSEMALPDIYCEASTRPREYEPCKSLPACVEDR